MDVPATPDDTLDHGVGGALHYLMSSLLQTFHVLLREVLLDSDIVRIELMMETRIGDCLTQLPTKV